MIKKILGFVLALVLVSPTYAANWLGTGFFVTGDGYLATAGHVVKGSTHLTVVYHGKRYDATVVGTDYEHDTALIHINALNSHPYAVRPHVGIDETVFILGFPLPDRFGWDMKITQGTVYNTDEEVMMKIHSYPGNSGGPVVDDNNNAVGVLVSGYSLGIVEGSVFSQGEKIENIVNLAIVANVKLNIHYSKTGSKYTMADIKAQALDDESVVLIFGTDQ